MKVRLVARNEDLFLVKCNGDIDRIFKIDAREFLLNFRDPKYLDVAGSWFHDSFTIDSFSGATIAYVTEQGDLVIKSMNLFRKIIVEGDTDYLTVKEYAALHGKAISTIRRLCQHGKLPGAVLRGKYYLIPANAPYPESL